jgi:hypothetical protein
MRNSLKIAYITLIFMVSGLWCGVGYSADIANLEQLISSKNINVPELRSMGPDIMPDLVTLYKRGDSMRRATIAWVWYQLEWKSPEAREVMLTDINTTHQDLRLQVQWALGRVSDDTEIVQILLDKMMNDSNPLFRDKAACALASDQIHLSDHQRVEILNGLIKGMESDNAQVRDISIKAMKIQTGQTKQFNPNAPATQRAQKIIIWRQWLDEYKSNL